jgi:hypothetical protein
MSNAEDAPKLIDADLPHDLIGRLRDLEAIVKQLNERPRPGALRGFWSARSRPARIGAAAVLAVLAGASMVFAETGFTGLFVDKSGNVGIGTTEPGDYKLRVNGSLSVAGPVKVGTDSILVASEPLRLVHGTTVDSIVGRSGSERGYRVDRSEDKDPSRCLPARTALYRVTFEKPFTGMPTASVTAMSRGDPRQQPPTEQTATLVSLGNKDMVVRVWTPNCSETPPIFSFIAIGPA